MVNGYCILLVANDARGRSMIDVDDGEWSMINFWPMVNR